jgi:hypothetical protein
VRAGSISRYSLNTNVELMGECYSRDFLSPITDELDNLMEELLS